MPDGGAGSRVAVGRINGVWGLRGHVKVTSLTSNSERFRAGSVLLVRGEPRTVLDVATPKGYPCVLFEGYEDRKSADGLRGTMIEVDEADLPELPSGEYYVDDLVGLTVVTSAGEELGRLAEVLHTGANDVYVVRKRQRRDLLIPAIADVVVNIDVDAGRVVIEPIEGLLSH